MPIGRAWEALREDEIACRAMGLNHVLVKLSAFMLGASTAGIARVFFASYQGLLTRRRSPFESALILAIVVLGEWAPPWSGTGGVCSDGHPGLLRGFDEYQVLLFSVLMVMMMIWRPRDWCAPAAAGLRCERVAP
ncbi:ABC transporter permease subunit [Klebsiella quasipneumoniae subsp. similipneumoniae]